MNNKLSQKEIVSAILSKYPDRIPAFVTFSEDINVKQNKYLIPKEYTIGEFSNYMRKKVSLTKTQGMIIIVGNTLPIMSDTIDAIYHLYKDRNGMLQIKIQIENTFG